MSIANEPAFPMDNLSFNGPEGLAAGIAANGLTKREYFAARMMQGTVANPSDAVSLAEVADGVPETINRALALNAVMQADALIAALEKE